MSCRFSICVSVVAVAGLSLAAGGCTEVRGRKQVQDANELYKRGRYREAVARLRAGGDAGAGAADAVAEQGLHLPAADRARRQGRGQPAGRRLRAGRVQAAGRAGAAGSRAPTSSPSRPGSTSTISRRWRRRSSNAPRARPTTTTSFTGCRRSTSSGGSGRRRWQWSQRAAALRATDAEAQYGVGTFIWQILAARGGGADMAAFDPRPRCRRRPTSRRRGPRWQVAQAQATRARRAGAPGDGGQRHHRQAARRAGGPGDRLPRQGAGAAPALRGRDDVHGPVLAAEVVRAVRRADAWQGAVTTPTNGSARHWWRARGRARRWRSRPFAQAPAGDDRARRGAR